MTILSEGSCLILVTCDLAAPADWSSPEFKRDDCLWCQYLLLTCPMEKFQVEATFEVWTVPRDFSPQQGWISLHGVYFLSLHFIILGEGI